MNGMKDRWSEYEQNMQKKKELLSRAAQIAQSQAEMIREDQIETLRESMQERERITREIDRIDARCAQIRRRISDGAPDTCTRLGESEKGMMELLIRIQTADQANGEQLRGKLREYQSQLRQLRQTRKGMEGYTRTYASEDGIFFDTRK